MKPPARRKPGSLAIVHEMAKSAAALREEVRSRGKEMDLDRHARPSQSAAGDETTPKDLNETGDG